MAFLFVSAAIAFLIGWRPRRFSANAFFVFLCVALFLGAWWRAAREMTRWENISSLDSTLERAEVVREPVEKETSKRVVLRAISCSSSCPEALVLGILPSFSDIAEGDILSLSCRLEKPERFSSDFDYPKVLAKDDIGYVCRFPKNWTRDGTSHGVLSASIRSARVRIEAGIERALPEPESGLVEGILIGGDDRLPQNIQDEFSRTGLSHIVAVSGYNVSIIAVLLMNALVFAGLYRQQALGGALFGIFVFTVLVGAPASAVRAAVMASVGLCATFLGRPGNSTQAILFAAGAMLGAQPLLLRYDIGFQLSFAATVGIFSFASFAIRTIRMGDVLATTLAAELFVLPIILFHFHSLPTLSLLANVLVLPFVPVAMLLGSVAAVFGILVPFLAVPFGFPAFLVSRGILSIVGFFASRSFASVSVASFGLGAVVAWYGALFFVQFLFSRKSLHYGYGKA